MCGGRCGAGFENNGGYIRDAALVQALAVEDVCVDRQGDAVEVVAFGMALAGSVDFFACINPVSGNWLRFFRERKIGVGFGGELERGSKLPRC